MDIPREEQEYLQQTLAMLREELQRRTRGHEEIEQELYEERRYLWQELVGNDRAVQDNYEKASQMSDIKESEKTENSSKQQIAKLRRMLQVSYFARIDFQENGEVSPEKVYIGKFGYTDLATFTPVVCDWRSEIASLYYNFAPGAAEYTCPDGIIQGEMTRKRQFQIERGTLLGCFDTEISIEDQFLQRILGAKAGESMKTIVESIQKGQDEVIRDTESAVVLLLGCAGSGKTSIALHRLAYLLYRSRSTLSASDCMIFSPNNLFSEYIDSVLPDLGEESVWQTTFADFASSIFGKNYDVHSYLQSIADDVSPLQEKKGSAEFAAAVRKAGEAFENAIRFSNLDFAHQTVFSSEELAEQTIILLLNEVLHRLEVEKENVRQRVADELVEQFGIGSFLSEKDLAVSARAETIRRTQELERSFDEKYRPDCFAIYAALLEKEFGIQEKTAFEARLADRLLWFEDAAPLLYLMKYFGMLSQQKKMRHIIIDEAQDYSELQFMLLLEMYPHAYFTILGDPKQALSGSGEFWRVSAELSGRTFRRYELNVNYRSSKEIVEFTNSLAGEELCRAIDRSGGPVLHKAVTLQALAEEISAFLDEGEPDELRAVICADGEECRRGFTALNCKDCCLLTHEFSARNKPICVLPVYLAKGLEFDRVAVVAGQKLTGNRLYVACTRALHKLALFEVEE